MIKGKGGKEKENEAEQAAALSFDCVHGQRTLERGILFRVEENALADREVVGRNVAGGRAVGRLDLDKRILLLEEEAPDELAQRVVGFLGGGTK